MQKLKENNTNTFFHTTVYLYIIYIYIYENVSYVNISIKFWFNVQNNLLYYQKKKKCTQLGSVQVQYYFIPNITCDLRLSLKRKHTSYLT